jgi:hypothetical protein
VLEPRRISLFHSPVPLAALAMLVATSTSGADFIEEARAIDRALGCRDVMGPPTEYCSRAIPSYAWYRDVYLGVARPFLGSLRPEDSPDVAVHLFGGGDLLLALTAYGDVHELTTIAPGRAGDPRKLLKMRPVEMKSSELAQALIALAIHGYEPRSLKYFRLDEAGAIHYFEAAELKRSEQFANAELTYAWPGERDLFVHRFISGEVSDAKLKRNPSLLQHLQAKGPILALVAESGYLLWQESHSAIRGYLLANMVSMLSDTSGIPPSIAAAAGFAQRTFGHFQGSSLVARAQYQREMKYLWSSPKTEVLPFRFGYVDVDGHYQLLVTERGAPNFVVPAGKFPADQRVDSEDVVEGGKHWRLWTRRGAVHVWMPAGFEARRGGLVYYLHGYYVNADGAWEQHRLAAQFNAARKNALYVVPEASAGDYEEPFWDDPGELLALVTSLIKMKSPPAGPTIVLAHSGGFRTAARWTKSARIRQLHLIDGFYGSQAPRFREWLGMPGPHQLILTSTDTADRSAAFAQATSGAAMREMIPEAANELSEEEKRARLLFMRSQYEHMELITGEKMIPLSLDLAPLEPIN